MCSRLHVLVHVHVLVLFLFFPFITHRSLCGSILGVLYDTAVSFTQTLNEYRTHFSNFEHAIDSLDAPTSIER